MGARLIRYYIYIGDERGIDGKVRLAHLTRIPAIKAATEPDSREVVELFMEKVKELTGKEAPAY